jgi:hypothetical protein
MRSLIAVGTPPQLYPGVAGIATSLVRDMGATVATEAWCLSIRNGPTLSVLVRRSFLVQSRLASEEQPIRLSAQFG